MAFNLGNVFNAGAEAEGFEQAITDTVTRIRPAYEKAKVLALLKQNRNERGIAHWKKRDARRRRLNEQ